MTHLFTLRFHMSRLMPLALLLLVLLLPASTAFAQRAEPPRGLGFRGWGPRVGVTAGPDQIHFGAQADLGSIARRVRFVPNLEVGLGDNSKLTALNLEIAYRFTSRWYAWAPYLGGGPAFLLLDTDPKIGKGDTSTHLGLNLQFGLERGFSRGKFFVDGRIGLADAPDFKATVGWTFLLKGAEAEKTGTM